MTTQAAQDIAAKTQPAAQIGRVVFIAFLGLAAIAWIGIAVAANSRTPGLIGFAAAVFGGFFVALLIAAVGGGIALKLSEPRTSAPPSPMMGADELGGEMHAILTDLETYRQHVTQQVKERSAWRVPACAGVGLCIWTLTALAGAPGGTMDFIVVMVVGGFVGYFWSVKELSQQYAKLYRERVLPRLAASFGEITWRDAVMPDLARLKAEHVFRSFGEAHATNELAGTYRGLPINIVELKLMSAEEKKRDEAVFDGLLIDIDLKRDTGATTAVVSDAGAFGNLRDRLDASGRQRVMLEDVDFERVYEVYSTDQIAARALLHPALMERLLQLGRRGDFGQPVLLCTGSRLTVATPKAMDRALFEPPGFTKPAANRETLLRLRGDIEAALGLADALVDLDHRFGATAR